MNINQDSFNKISSLESLSNYLNPPLANGEWGILALDLDQTLIQAKPTFGDENFYLFLKEQNKLQHINPDGHYQWSVKIRSNIAYETCEPFDRINAILKNFRVQGWSVQVLTSRGLDMKELTIKHLKDSLLDISIDDVIFKERHPLSQKLLSKDESLIKWMETQQEWTSYHKKQIVFPDDSIKYCSEVSNISNKVTNTTVHCLHYIGALPNPSLSNEQMNQLVVQLHSYYMKKPISYNYSENELAQAKKDLNIHLINKEEIYQIIFKLAMDDLMPFS